MPMATDPTRSRRLFFFAVGLATALAVWLRAYGVTGQVVLDDEWHAIHKLSWSTYGNIFKTFGLADHSIPLTLLYKYMADTIGLAEGRMRVLQIACGVALVPVCAWVAWGAVRDRAAAALFAFMVAGAPFLVMWSRFARPYSISLLFVVVAVAAIWRWRGERSREMATTAAVTAALATWFHPLMGLYPAVACSYVFIEDLRDSSGDAARRWPQSLRFSASIAAAMSVLLISPLYHDRESLRGKSGGDHPTLETYERMLSIVWGGLPAPASYAALALTVVGFMVIFRRHRALAGFLAALGLFPALFLTITGAVWIHVAHAFLRYQLPLQPLLLFLCGVGAIAVVRRIAQSAAEPAAWAAVLALSAGYLYATPAIMQVARLGTWYAHGNHHWDYRHRFMRYFRNDPRYDPPQFYRDLGASEATTIVEAPYIWEAPYNVLGYWATYHHQRELFGMLHDLCGTGQRIGEIPPRDRRFRFRRFVFLDNPASVKATGASHLVYNLDFQTRFAPLERERCVAKLTALYGPPIEKDERVVVWRLRR